MSDFNCDVDDIGSFRMFTAYEQVLQDFCFHRFSEIRRY